MALSLIINIKNSKLIVVLYKLNFEQKKVKLSEQKKTKTIIDINHPTVSAIVLKSNFKRNNSKTNMINPKIRVIKLS